MPSLLKWIINTLKQIYFNLKYINMKKLAYTFALVFIFNCSSDNGPNNAPAIPGDTNTEFVIGNNAYVTPKAYLLVDDAAGDYDRAFSFVFTDGNLIEDATNEIAFETSTTNFTKITCNLIATKPTLAETPFFVWDPQSNPNGFINIVMDGHHLSQFGISNFSNTNTMGNLTFGQPSNGTIYNHTALADGDSSNGGLFTINSRTFDLNTMTGTIDCSYSYVDDNNVTITGVYIGTYEILTAF